MLADRLRIEGDGNPRTTKVFLDDELISGLQGVTWELHIDHARATVTLVLIGNPEIAIAPKT